MAFRKSKNQKGVAIGKIRFEFDLRLLGTRHRKMLICQKSAVQSLYRQWERQIMDGTDNNFKFFEILDEYLNHVQQVKSSGAHIHERMVIEKFVKKYFRKDILLHEIKRSHIEDFSKWRRKHNRSKYGNKTEVSNSTINHSIATLSSFFNWSIIRGYYVAVNPCYKTKLRENNIREIRLNMDQIRELIEKAEAYDERLYCTIMIAICTGMRFGEILSLKWTEVDFDNSRICLSRLKTKGKRARFVPIVPTLKNILLSLKNSNPSSESVLNVTENLIRMQWKRFRPSLSFVLLEDGTRFRFHDIRHVFAQHLMDQGVQLEDIQAILGHRDFRTTQQRYAPFSRPDLLAKAKVIEKVIPFRKVVGDS
ncbi:MAG TPA: tyrosine-type recombinase/integrase [Spirochaetota bacterium]|nr:tyrosine-type recombinase/integrase [Spirochaetota bacterium]